MALSFSGIDQRFHNCRFMARLCWVLLLCLPAGCALSFGVSNAPRAPNDCTGLPNRPGCSP